MSLETSLDDDELIQRLNKDLIQKDFNDDPEQNQSTIHKITERLDELKTIKDRLLNSTNISSSRYWKSDSLIDIERKEMKFWDEHSQSHEQKQKETNLFHQYLDASNEEKHLINTTTESAHWSLSPTCKEDFETVAEQITDSNEQL